MTMESSDPKSSFEIKFTYCEVRASGSGLASLKQMLVRMYFQQAVGQYCI
jgi:hypothetical protein